MKTIVFLIGLAIFFLVVAIAITNQQEVTVTYFYDRSWTGRLWVVIMASFATGALMATVFAALLLLREKFRFSMLNRKTGKLEDEVKSLRQRPLPDEHPVFPSVASMSTTGQTSGRPS